MRVCYQQLFFLVGGDSSFCCEVPVLFRFQGLGLRVQFGGLGGGICAGRVGLRVERLGV